MRNILSLDSLQLPSDDLPTEIRLLQMGSNPTSKGDLILDADGLKAVIDGYQEAGVDLPFDLDHQTLYTESNGQPAPAMGWFIPTAKADGLYASNIRWTDQGAQYLRSKQYRYFSPTVEVDADNRVVGLLPCALTNFPAMEKIPALVPAKATPSRKDTTLSMKLVLTSLGLKDDADEATALSAVVKLTDLQKEIFALSGKANISEALGALQAMKQAHEQVITLSARIQEFEAKQAETEINNLVNEAVNDGRIPPAKKDTFIDLGKRDLITLKTCLEMLPKLPGQDKPAEQPKVETGIVGLTDAEKQVALKMGRDPAKLAALKAKTLQKEGN